MNNIALLSSKVDPSYEPPEVETKQVFGISLQQRRNNAKIDARLFANIVTVEKEVRGKLYLIRIYSLILPISFLHLRKQISSLPLLPSNIRNQTV